MNAPKPTKWEVITTIIVLLLCGVWAVYEYRKDATTIPFEPIIAVISSLFVIGGFIRWRQHKESIKTDENSGDNITGDKKTYHINEIENADFGDKNIKNAKNVIGNDAIIQAKRDIHIGDIITYENGKKIPKHLGTIPTFPDLFIGRTNEVEAIHQRLTTQQNILLLVNGQGGIGKTTLASKYYYHYQNHYQHLVWVFSEISIIEALLTLALPLGVAFLPQADNATKLDILLQAMMQLNKPCLLIMDNANQLADIEQYHNRLLSCTNFHILLTTRVNKAIHNTELYEVKPLDKTDALEIFKKHYPEHDAAEDDLFFSLFEKVDSNTLVVELLAKNLTNFNDGLETEYTLNNLLQDLNTSLLKLSKSEKVATFYQSEDGFLRSETPENIIAAMYDLSRLAAIEKHYLSIFSVLPAESIPYAILKDLAPQDGLNKILLALFHKGWLDYDKNGGSFRISPVVQEVIRNQQDNLYQDCEMLISQLIDKLDYDGEHLTGATYEAAAILTRYGESIVVNLKDLEDNLATLCDRIGNYHRVTGNLSKALEFFEKFTDLTEALSDSYPNNEQFKNGLAISYSKLGETHSALGNLDKALGFFQERSKLGKELYESYPNNVSFKNGLAISYSKLGETHSALGNLDKALGFFQERSKLGKELYESYPNNVSFKNGLAISYEKLGSTHSALGNLDKALGFFQDETVLFEELYESYPNNVSFKNGLAISYAKLAQYYQAMNNHLKAIEHFKYAEKLWEELVIQAPQYVQFQEYLEQVRSILNELE